MPASTVADLAELLVIEAEEARAAWEEALRLEAEGFRLDPIHWPLAGVLPLGIVPIGVRDLGRALLAESEAEAELHADGAECDVWQ
jgi:hypothetical protein